MWKNIDYSDQNKTRNTKGPAIFSLNFFINYHFIKTLTFGDRNRQKVYLFANMIAKNNMN